jgi:hypothetical protein
MNIMLKIELDRLELLETYPKCIRKIQKVGWLPFFKRYSDHDTKVTCTFALGFEGAGNSRRFEVCSDQRLDNRRNKASTRRRELV